MGKSGGATAIQRPPRPRSGHRPPVNLRCEKVMCTIHVSMSPDPFFFSLGEEIHAKVAYSTFTELSLPDFIISMEGHLYM